MLAASIIRAIALSVNSYQTTRRNNPEDSHLYTRSRENLKSHNAHNCSALLLFHLVFKHQAP
jgi:hypothetical protein